MELKFVRATLMWATNPFCIFIINITHALALYLILRLISCDIICGSFDYSPSKTKFDNDHQNSFFPASDQTEGMLKLLPASFKVSLQMKYNA